MSDKISINNKDQTPFEKFQGKISGNKRIFRSTLLRGLFFLVLAIIITYYAKFHRGKIKIVNSHGLVGWIFKKDSVLSALIIMPNDGNYENDHSSGERFFINPLKDPALLNANYIRYNKKDLYLFGNIFQEHLGAYCGEIDSLSILYLHRVVELNKSCSSAVYLPDSKTIFLGDRNMRVVLNSDTLSKVQALTMISRGQKIVFSWGLKPDVDSVSLYVDLSEPTAGPDVSEVYISSSGCFRNGTRISDIELADNTQALGFSVDKNDKLLIKKLWLEKPIY